jgi:hypothetical protein
MISELFTPQPYGPFHYMTTKLNIVLIIVSWVAFALRLWVRQKYLKSYSTDDWLMLVALVSSLLPFSASFEKSYSGMYADLIT